MSRGLQKTPYEKWEEIGQDVEEARRAVLDLVDTLESVPKSEWNDQHVRIMDAFKKLKSDLEDRMFEEHPDRASTDVFYGFNDE